LVRTLEVLNHGDVVKGQVDVSQLFAPGEVLCRIHQFQGVVVRPGANGGNEAGSVKFPPPILPMMLFWR
jgi:ribosomal protein L19